MKTKPHHVYNLIILDESGSMESIKEAVIRGFNEVVQTVKDVEAKFPEQKHFISLVSFNGAGMKELLWNQEVSKLQTINNELYDPDFSTPLYDAIGIYVARLNECLPKKVSHNVLVTILTDGEENASTIYSGADIKKLIDRLKTASWTFAYIGANHDVEANASKISITNTLQFEANKASVDRMFLREKQSRMAFANRVNLVLENQASPSNIAFNENLYKDEEPEEENA